MTIKIGIDKASQAIAKAADSGATGVSQVQLKTAEKELFEAKNQALKKAIDNAMQSAQVALSSLNLELKEIETVIISNPEPMPLHTAAFTALKAASAPSLEGDQEVQADVTLKLRFRNTN